MKKFLLLSLFLYFCSYSFSQNLQITPSSADINQTLDVTITGENMHFGQGSTTIYFEYNFANINSLDIVNSNRIDANITIKEYTVTGNYSVAVYSSYDGYNSVTDHFYINGVEQPYLSSISPSTCENGQTLDVSIIGENTHFTIGNTSLHFEYHQGTGVAKVNSLNILNDTELSANITVQEYAHVGSYNLHVSSAVDGYLSLSDGLYVDGLEVPEIVSINPSSVNSGESLDVTIIGENTHFNQESTSIYFEYGQGSPVATVNSVNVINNTTLSANITVRPEIYTGDYDIYINSPIDGSRTLYNGLHINGLGYPTLASINPSEASIGETLDVTIIGENTHFTQGSTTVYFGYYQGSRVATVNSVNIESNTQILANITVNSNVQTGNYSYFIHNSTDGHLTKYNGFYIDGINPPSIISVNPNNIEPGTTVDVTIIGNNTHFNQGEIDFFLEYYQGLPFATINSVNTISNTEIVINISIRPNIPERNYYFYLHSSYDDVSLLESFYIEPQNINEIPNSSFFEVYPNPARDIISLNYTSKTDNLEKQITLYDTKGSTILNSKFDQISKEINIESLEKGVYIICVESKEGTVYKKFVKN
jgi:hypothetical protein